jgi:hypothetical protein
MSAASGVAKPLAFSRSVALSLFWQDFGPQVSPMKKSRFTESRSWRFWKGKRPIGGAPDAEAQDYRGDASTTLR